MADDLSIAGRLVALDEVIIEGATKLVPRDKVGFGAPGTWVDVQDADGARLPVDSPTLEALITTLTTPARPTNLPGTSGLVIADTTFMGYSVKEAAGTPAAAAMRLRAGGATGAILATVTLAAGESTSDWFGPSGIAAAGGVYLELLSGTITGGVQTR